ncbi:MAG: hypothetical protein ACLR9W_08640 [Enterobacter hormaechei]
MAYFGAVRSAFQRIVVRGGTFGALPGLQLNSRQHFDREHCFITLFTATSIKQKNRESDWCQMACAPVLWNDAAYGFVCFIFVFRPVVNTYQNRGWLVEN